MDEGVRDLDQLAGQLGRPPTSLLALRDLTPDQVVLLSDAIEAACARQRRIADTALERAIPAGLPRRIVLRLLRVRGG